MLQYNNEVTNVKRKTNDRFQINNSLSIVLNLRQHDYIES